MKGTLENKVCIVTGGSSGIGRAAALLFAREGARVAIADIDVAGGEETVREIKQAGGDAMFIRADVSLEAEVTAMVDRTVAAYGRLDCAFNNAGVEAPRTRLVDRTEEEWDRIVDVDLKGVFLCMKHEIAAMLRSGGGSVVNHSSIGGRTGYANTGPYVAAKHGVEGLTKSTALEYAREGIRVNSVASGATQTPMIMRRIAGGLAATASPMGRMGTPEEIAQAAMWLCSDASSYVNGVSLAVDGGVLAH